MSQKLFADKHTHTTTSRQVLEQLWQLSDFPQEKDINWLSENIQHAPDPETACQEVTSQIAAYSEALERKWRLVINEAWFEYHPQASGGIHLPLTTEEVSNIPALIDAHALLEALREKPASVVRRVGSSTIIDEQDIERLASRLPAHRGSVSVFHRLHTLLQTLRLVRVQKDQLVVVRSRYNRFQQLPLIQQFYVLWHVDAYHVDWDQFAGGWQKHVAVIQSYLPLLWEVSSDIEEGMEDTMYDVTQIVMELYRPLWNQEGLVISSSGRNSFLSLFEQCALPATIEKILLRDLLLRYGAIVPSEGKVLHGMMGHQSSLLGEDGDFAWTNVGAVILEAERSRQLPCGLELLN